jgi:hypothetical protein
MTAACHASIPDLRSTADSGTVDGGAVLAGLLGSVHGLVGPDQHVGTRDTSRVEHGDAHPDGDSSPFTVREEAVTFAHRIDHGCGDVLRLRLGCSGKHDGVVVADPAEDVGLPQTAAQNFGNRTDQLVTGIVAEGVIDFL